MAERIRATAAATILGVTVRTVQALAQRGTIPAARVGGLWTFSEPELRAWLREQAECRRNEVEPCRRGAIGAAASSGSAPRSRGGNTARAYEQAIQRLRGGRPSTFARG